MSLFYPRLDMPRCRVVSHGGLGGFVSVNIEDIDHYSERSPQYPESRLEDRPLPQLPNIELDTFWTSPIPSLTTLSTPSQRDRLSPLTPWSPCSSVDNDQYMAKSASLLYSPPMSRYNTSPTVIEGHFSTCGPRKRVQTETRAVRTSLSPPVELAGSLLLPSQGFPQKNPPSAPPRSAIHSDCISTTFSSGSLSPSDRFACTTISEDLAMAPRPAQALKRMKIVTALQSPFNPNKRPSNQVVENLPGKPLSTMSVKELLEALPLHDPTAIHDVWLPEMSRKFEEHMSDLDQYYAAVLAKNSECTTLEMTAINKFYQMCDISNDFRALSQSLETIAERDTKELQKKIKILENEVRENKWQIGSLEDDLTSQSRETQRVKNWTIFGSLLANFVQEYMVQFSTVMDPRDLQKAQLFISEFADPTVSWDDCDVASIRAADQRALLEQTREAQEKVKEWKEFAKMQHDELSKKDNLLDTNIALYAEAAKKHGLLHKDVTRLEKACSDKDAIIADIGSTLQDNVRMSNTIKHLEAVNLQQTSELKSLGAEIADLKRRLAHAKNVAMPKSSQDKVKGSSIAGSRSLQALGLPSLDFDPMSSAGRINAMDTNNTLQPSSSEHEGGTSPSQSVSQLYAASQVELRRKGTKAEGLRAPVIVNRQQQI